MPEDPKPFSQLLPELVKAGKAAGVQPTIALSVGGTLIFGELIDGEAYFNELVLEIRAIPSEALSPKAATQFVNLFQRFADRYTHPPTSSVPPQSAVESEHIHLRHARIRLSDGSDLQAGPQGLWRVRLDAVDAVTLGLLPAAQQR
jgi:hypothetical protein